MASGSAGSSGMAKEGVAELARPLDALLAAEALRVVLVDERAETRLGILLEG
jgi:hypothetical protein